MGGRLIPEEDILWYNTLKCDFTWLDGCSHVQSSQHVSLAPEQPAARSSTPFSKTQLPKAIMCLQCLSPTNALPETVWSLQYLQCWTLSVFNKTSKTATLTLCMHNKPVLWVGIRGCVSARIGSDLDRWGLCALSLSCSSLVIPHNLKNNVLNATSRLSNSLSVCSLLAKSPLQIWLHEASFISWTKPALLFGAVLIPSWAQMWFGFIFSDF